MLQLLQMVSFVSSWLYRIVPSVKHKPFTRLPCDNLTESWNEVEPDPNQVGDT